MIVLEKISDFFGKFIALIVLAVLALFVPLPVEIDIQNSGLAASLTGTAFPNLAMATVPDAIFSAGYNISWRRGTYKKYNIEQYVICFSESLPL
ncbi:MAG: hypothetical protein K2K54_02740 [Lachnospiraceae bacterium]|nr:hypothetical protein [Lachnospiraceae bacterium]